MMLHLCGWVSVQSTEGLQRKQYEGPRRGNPASGQPLGPSCDNVSRVPSLPCSANPDLLASIPARWFLTFQSLCLPLSYSSVSLENADESTSIKLLKISKDTKDENPYFHWTAYLNLQIRK